MHFLAHRQFLLFFALIFLLFQLDTKAQQPKLMLPEGHVGAIRWTSLSSDGKYLLSYGDGPDVFMWETATGKLIRKIQTELSSAISGAKFSPNGKFIVTISNGLQDNFSIWNTATGENSYNQHLYDDEKYFFTAKHLFVSENFNDSITVANLETGNVKHISHGISLIRGNQLFFYQDNLLKRWDPETDRPLVNYQIGIDTLLKTNKNFRIYDNKPFYIEVVDGFLVNHLKNSDELFELATGKALTSTLLKNQVLAKSKRQEYVAWAEKKQVFFHQLKSGITYKHPALDTGNSILTPLVFGDHYLEYVVSSPTNKMSITTLQSSNILSGKKDWQLTFPYKLYLTNLKHATIFCYTENETGPNVYFLLDLITGKKIKDFNGVLTSENEKLMVLVDNTSKKIEVIDRKSLRPICTIEGKKTKGKGVFFLNDSLLFNGRSILNVKTLKTKYFFPGKYQGTDTQHSVIVMNDKENQSTVFNLSTGAKIATIEGELEEIFDNGLLISSTSSEDKDVAWIYDYHTGALLSQINGTLSRYLSSRQRAHRAIDWTYHATHNFIFFDLEDQRTTVFNFSTKNLSTYKGEYQNVDIASRYMTTSTSDSTYVYELANGKLIGTEEKQYKLGDKLAKIANWQFHFPEDAKLEQQLLSYDGKYIMGIYKGDSIIVSTLDHSYTSKKIKINLLNAEENLFGNRLTSFLVSKDQKLLYTTDLDYQFIYNLETGKATKIEKPFLEEVIAASFSANNKFINTKSFISSEGGVTYITSIAEISTGKIVARISGVDQSTFIGNPSATLFAENNNNLLELFNANTGKLLYKYIEIDAVNQLITDQYGRYDGSEEARKQLYFTCGMEVIDLEQVKDQLWIPNLGSRIMSGENINAAKLSDLAICGLSPEVDTIPGAIDEHRFKIKPRKGGLGETVLFINNIEIKRLLPNQLLKVGDSYELRVPRNSLQQYLVNNIENQVTVKAYTAKNDILSRGAKISNLKSRSNPEPPNLYAVIVGVSDYKGTALDLKYAAKDANDISNALAYSSRKLLNVDGKEHVFIYNLNTNKEAQFPEKLAIKNTIAAIGKKAGPNDIFLVFFAGHGIMEGDKKQFYFLTADASKESSAAQAGISTFELAAWMQPDLIKAQKRILIFDACNSGQAINELVKIGGADQQYLAARNDDRSQQIKTIEKLNEKSGLFILSAAASNQSAYEMSRYNQGILTYALLKAIKEQPDILEENKYLSVGKWFAAAEKLVSDLVRENGARQEPQIVSTTNFNIGIVDNDVISQIKLPEENILFTSSNFQNSDEAIVGDDLELSNAINLALNDASARGTAQLISYTARNSAADAYALNGRYDVKNGVVNVRVNIWQHKTSKFKFEVTGKTDNLTALTNEIIKMAIDWASTVKTLKQ